MKLGINNLFTINTYYHDTISSKAVKQDFRSKTATASDALARSEDNGSLRWNCSAFPTTTHDCVYNLTKAFQVTICLIRKCKELCYFLTNPFPRFNLKTSNTLYLSPFCVQKAQSSF